jgi:hypothetical protein
MRRKTFIYEIEPSHKNPLIFPYARNDQTACHCCVIKQKRIIPPETVLEAVNVRGVVGNVYILIHITPGKKTHCAVNKAQLAPS